MRPGKNDGGRFECIAHDEFDELENLPTASSLCVEHGLAPFVERQGEKPRRVSFLLVRAAADPCARGIGEAQQVSVPRTSERNLGSLEEGI
jgi:hypothetical protein